MRPGSARPRLSLIVMDPFQKLACSLTQKNEEALGPNRVQEQHYKMARDGRVVRLICSSGSDTEKSVDQCPDQTSLTDSRRAAVGFRANTKIPLFIILDVLFISCSL